jgi:LmbE family N-acetylglucosaminyl deacetylase
MAGVLAVAVHPDDETLGCGATLLKHRDAGDEVHWLLVTALPDGAPVAERQRAQVETVRQEYGFSGCHWLKLPTSALDALPLNQLIAAIREVVERVRPAIVYVPNRSDVHSDHRIVFSAIQAVTKTFYMRTFGIRRVLACEVLSETDAAPALPEAAFTPNVFVDVTRTFERKVAIMQRYTTELHPEPLPRSISAVRALARYRGATIGVEAAEAFMLLRELVE